MADGSSISERSAPWSGNNTGAGGGVLDLEDGPMYEDNFDPNRVLLRPSVLFGEGTFRRSEFCQSLISLQTTSTKRRLCPAGDRQQGEEMDQRYSSVPSPT